MEIKFVTQVLLFMKHARLLNLRTTDRMLWLSIFYYANEIAQETGKRNIWPTCFIPIPNEDLLRMSGIKDERTLWACRDRLKAKELIDYIKGIPNISDPQYKINYLEKDGCITVPVIVPDSAPVHAASHDGSPVHETTNPGCNIAPANACDSVSEALNNQGFSLPDSEWYADADAGAAAGVRVLTAPSDISDLFGNGKFADLDMQNGIKPFANIE